MYVVVAAHNDKLRTTLCVWLGHLQSLELSGVARNSRELMRTLVIGQVDLAVLDWNLLSGQAGSVVAQARRLSPPPRIIVLCWETETTTVLSHEGIDAVADRALLPESLFQALRSCGVATVQG